MTPVIPILGPTSVDAYRFACDPAKLKGCNWEGQATRYTTRVFEVIPR